jgi:hypothetical protein
LFLLLFFSWISTKKVTVNKTDTGSLILKSGFENGVMISEDMRRISGSDVSGYDWGAASSWIRSSGFTYVISNGRKISDYMESFIERRIGPKGNETNILCLKNKADDPENSAVSRTELSFFGKKAPDDFKEGYVRYWMKLQDNIDQIFSFEEETPFYMIMEWKEPDSGVRKSDEECNACCDASKGGTNNYRININLKKDKNSAKFYWLITGEHPQPCRVTEWSFANKEIEVPFGKWFKVEAYMKKDAVRGRVFFAVNEKVVLDTDFTKPAGFTGRTQHNDNPMHLAFWSTMKNYHSMQWNKKGPISQWYDDFELWTGFPPGHPIRGRN